MSTVSSVSALLSAPDIARLQSALAPYTVDGVLDSIGLSGRSALARDDLDGLAAVLADDPVANLLRLFVLGEPLDGAVAARLLAPFPVEVGIAAGLLDHAGDAIAAAVEIRPYGEQQPLGAATDTSWWVLSDFGSDVRPGPVAPDHVLGIGTAALTLAQATPRRAVGRALDIGTGCGVQALHLSTHAQSVTATDVSSRALRLAATTAALNGWEWDLRAGSLLEPVRGERFDLIVANPPFVVSPGWGRADGGFDYRDSGLSGDEVSRSLITGLPAHLADGGIAQLLANWVIGADEGWDERLSGWLAGRGCDAWVWQREIAEPGEYVTMWLRDAGEVPGTPRWRATYQQWTQWLAANEVIGIGMGLVTMRRTDSAAPVVVCEDVPQPVEQPSGAHILAWFERNRWLAEHGDDQLLAQRLAIAADVRLVNTAVGGVDGWTTTEHQLRQLGGLRWEIDTDDAVAALLAGCQGQEPIGALLAVLAASVAAPTATVTSALLPVVRDLIARGPLLPSGLT